MLDSVKSGDVLLVELYEIGHTDDSSRYPRNTADATRTAKYWLTGK